MLRSLFQNIYNLYVNYNAEYYRKIWMEYYNEKTHTLSITKDLNY